MTMIIWTELGLSVLLFAVLSQIMSRQAILKRHMVVARRASMARNGKHPF